MPVAPCFFCVDFKELLGSAHQPPHHAASDEQAEDAVGNQQLIRN